MEYESVLENKNQIDNNINLILYEFDTKFQRAESTLNSALKTTEKMASVSGNNQEFSKVALKITKELHALYQLKIETLSILHHHNDNWLRLLSKQNAQLSKFGKNGLAEISTRLTAFFNYMWSKNENRYVQDAKLSESIKNISKTRKIHHKKTLKEIRAAYKE